MPQKWTDEVRSSYVILLSRLYVVENKSLGEISALLGWPEQTVYSRLKKVGIPLTPERKEGDLELKPTRDGYGTGLYARPATSQNFSASCSGMVI